MRSNHIALLLIGVLWLIAPEVKAHERHDQFTKSFQVTAATTIEIVNKYGKVQIIPWDKDSVKIVVDRTLRSNSEDRLDKIQDNVDFDFIHSPGFVTAKTIIGSRSTSVWTDLSTLTKTMFANGSNMTIDYTVYMPASNKLVVENRYGDIFTGELKGKVQIELSHGDLKGTSYEGNTDLTLKYGNASIKYVKSGTFSLEYADLNLDKANRLSLKSKSGKIQIDAVTDLRINARRGEYVVKKADVIRGETSFTTSNFIQVDQQLYYDGRYGKLTVDFVSAAFKSIKLNINYGDVNLTFSEATNYAIDITHKNSTITFPKDKALLNTVSLDSDDKQKRTTGQIGSNSNQLAKLNVEMERATLNLYSK